MQVLSLWLRSLINENSPNFGPHGQQWHKLNASAWKDAKILFSVLRNFFFSSDPKSRSAIFGRKIKAVSTEKETLLVSFSFGENDGITSES